MKPRLFIGSSSESIRVAYAAQTILQRWAEVTVWNQDVFELSGYTLESLLNELDKYDYGLFVFAADDSVIIRREQKTAVRDNVILELGLFIGRMGRERSFILMPEKLEQFRLPSDLLGINLATFVSDRTDDNIRAAIGPACFAIGERIRKLGFRPKPSTMKSNAKPRELCWEEILEAVSNARQQIVFLGGISQTLVAPRFYGLLAERLQNQPDLTVTMIYESDDNLFRRAQYLERPYNYSDRRLFRKLTAKKKDIETLADEVAMRVAPEKEDLVRSRIRLLETHLQLLLIVTQIDDLIFASPITNRRTSRSVTMRLDDKGVPFYALALEYANYFLSQNHGAPYCTPPGTEIIQIYDAQGIPRGYTARSTFDELPLFTKVVFGFVFDCRGRLLLQKRSTEAHDNRGLWDKSFGGHMVAPQDNTTVETAVREYREELCPLPDSRLSSPAYLGHWRSADLMSSVPFLKDKTFYMKLDSITNYISKRMKHEGGSTLKHLIVDLFAFYCPDPEQLSSATQEVEETRWCELDEVVREVRTNSDIYSFDLCKLMETSTTLDKLGQFSKLCKGKRA